MNQDFSMHANPLVCEEVIAARVEWLVTRWQADKTQEEKKADHKLNERMDHWMKEITKEQRDAIEDCIDDMLDGNGMCQLCLYEDCLLYTSRCV